MTTDCPAMFTASTTRANALLHWRMLNHSSINAKLDQVLANMNKEDRNNFIIPLPHWLVCYIPNLFITPQHILEQSCKKDRQIFDASHCYTWDSMPINRMTSTLLGSKEPCTFGPIMSRILQMHVLSSLLLWSHH